MRKKALILLAEGFEEMEAVITIDLLRRAGLEVISAAVGDKLLVLGSRKISVQADVFLQGVKDIPDALILPGGAKGADNLAASNTVIALVRRCFREGKVVAAICAAPAVVLAKSGILKGKKATCYPGDEAEFSGDVTFVKDDVVCDGTLITGRGPGTAFSFALAIIKKLCGEQVAANVKEKALI
ncbi:MAG: DJ-1/PfpI family protein [Candidatus Omnitrophica bacterium]|nr:DJ-1/PfpI family protein [Candidatus Omnitrophota bacterium]